jgi:mannose-6-phosphate isomerase-like protein (cupin superfamily)
MPVIRAADAVTHDLHGARFSSYAAPARGSHELCAWRVDLPGGSHGVPHTVSREEILFVLGGTPQVTMSGQDGAAGDPVSSGPGDVVVVPPGTTFQLDNPGREPASAWVTTSVGLEATLADGSRLTPPWVR